MSLDKQETETLHSAPSQLCTDFQKWHLGLAGKSNHRIRDQIVSNLDCFFRDSSAITTIELLS